MIIRDMIDIIIVIKNVICHMSDTAVEGLGWGEGRGRPGRQQPAT